MNEAKTRAEHIDPTPAAAGCVTQYEGVATCERISEAFLIPVLEALLHSFSIPSTLNP